MIMQLKLLNGKKEKFLYNQEAFNILSDYFNIKNINDAEDRNNLMIIKIQSKEIEELKNLSSTFQKYYEQEKEKKEDLLILTEDLKNDINNLQKDKINLQNEIDRLRNRSFIDRLLNRY